MAGRRVLVLLLTAVWGLRLGTHILAALQPRATLARTSLALRGQTLEDRTSTVKRSYPAASATLTLSPSTARSLHRRGKDLRAGLSKDGNAAQAGADSLLLELAGGGAGALRLVILGWLDAQTLAFEPGCSG